MITFVMRVASFIERLNRLFDKYVIHFNIAVLGTFLLRPYTFTKSVVALSIIIYLQLLIHGHLRQGIMPISMN